MNHDILSQKKKKKKKKEKKKGWKDIWSEAAIAEVEVVEPEEALVGCADESSQKVVELVEDSSHEQTTETSVEAALINLRIQRHKWVYIGEVIWTHGVHIVGSCCTHLTT